MKKFDDLKDVIVSYGVTLIVILGIGLLILINTLDKIATKFIRLPYYRLRVKLLQIAKKNQQKRNRK